MRSFTVTDFVAHVSRSSEQAFIIISIDPNHLFSVDESKRLRDALAAPLNPKTADMIVTCCGAHIILPTLAEAHDTLTGLERIFPRIPGAGLIAAIYVGGHLFHEIRQDDVRNSEIPLAQRPTLM